MAGPIWKRSRRSRLALAMLASVGLLATSCGTGGFDGGKDAEGLAAGDYTIASADGVVSSVVVNGKIAPVRAVNITTKLQSEVERVAVAPGDRVQAEQHLASMNTEQLERQLAIQEKQQANAQADAMQSVEQAQAQLNALDESINNGTNPTIRQAQTQLNQAQAAYNAAAGGGRMVTRAVRVATQLAGHVAPQILAAGGRDTSGHSFPTGQALPGAPGMNGEQGRQVAALPEMPGAPEEQGYPGADMAGPNVPGGGAAMSVDEAYAALEDAKANLAAARAQVEQERLQLQGQVDSAWRQAELAQLDTGDGNLEFQVQEATIYSPIAGIVTSVDVHEGDIPQGKLLSIADDSRLLIRADVREADVTSVQKGNRVTFTSTATGKQEYTGKVTRISPANLGAESTMGSGAGAAAAMPAQMGSESSSSVTFPVEIEVTGSTEGLLLGGSVRAEIITQESANAVAVPRDAIYEDEGKKKVLVLATDGDDSRSGTLEERTVETGTENDVDVAVTGGELKPGDIVINWVDTYRDRVGEKVAITDPGFNPEAVQSAKKPTAKTTATVTQTSTKQEVPETTADANPNSGD